MWFAVSACLWGSFYAWGRFLVRTMQVPPLKPVGCKYLSCAAPVLFDGRSSLQGNALLGQPRKQGTFAALSYPQNSIPPLPTHGSRSGCRSRAFFPELDRTVPRATPVLFYLQCRGKAFRTTLVWLLRLSHSGQCYCAVSDCHRTIVNKTRR